MIAVMFKSLWSSSTLKTESEAKSIGEIIGEVIGELADESVEEEADESGEEGAEDVRSLLSFSQFSQDTVNSAGLLHAGQL